MAVHKHVSFNMKSGHECSHTPATESEDKWWEYIFEVTNAVNSGRPGVLLTQEPYGLHRIDDISAVHFADAEPPVETPPIGFPSPSA